MLDFRFHPLTWIFLYLSVAFLVLAFPLLLGFTALIGTAISLLLAIVAQLVAMTWDNYHE